MNKLLTLALVSAVPAIIYGCASPASSPTASSYNSYSQSQGALSPYDSAVQQPNAAPSASASGQTAQDDVKNKISGNSEEYTKIYENQFLEVNKNPLSTFSIDVDTASYSNIRRFIESGQTPPKDAARIEEMINYFTYNYPQPTGNDPFSINMEMSTTPWNKEHKLVQIGLQGKVIDKKNIPASNLVFLIDTSGSMSGVLPMLKDSFKLLVNQLRPEDRVSIVSYAGSAGLVLDSTPGSEKNKIIQAIDRLESGGSTAGGEGINLAYKVAKTNFIKNGNNRVILATDGDFNVGPSSDSELVKIIEEKRTEGTFLSVLGFGMGNYKDSKMEQLADKGNGNYAYIDSLKEAQKVFVNQMGGTLLPIAKDVKLQIEFNPAKIKSYRLIGYENRKLNNEDFNDDKKDAGELGAGTSVTAFYELIPANSQEKLSDADVLKDQVVNTTSETTFKTDEMMNVKFRYKDPKEDQSQLITKSLIENNIDINQTSDNFRFATAVAGFGLILRDSQFKGTITLNDVMDMAKKSKGIDSEGYRTDFIKLLDSYNSIKK